MKRRNEIKLNKKGNIILKEDLKNLDDFIQKCLDNFKFVEPKKELYESTGIDKDIIISHKSTIPDLVIWNKTFNKNNCFIGANTSIQNEFPRFLFYIKIKKNKKTKNNNNIKNNNKKDINDFDIEAFENNNKKTNININDINNNLTNESNTNINFIEDQNKNNPNMNLNNNKNNTINNYYENFVIQNKNKEKNIYPINPNINVNPYLNNINNINNTNNTNNINNSNMINLTIYLIQLYMDKNGWIILTKDEHFSGPGTSIDLFQFLHEKIKENINLNELIIIDLNKQVKFFGNYFFMLLSNILPTLIQKKQMELIKFENLMNKQFKNQKSFYDNIHNNHLNNLNINKNNYNYNFFNCINFNNNIENNNIINNQLFSGRNYNQNKNFPDLINFSNGNNKINYYNINNNKSPILFTKGNHFDKIFISKDNNNSHNNKNTIENNNVKNEDK